MHRDRRRRQRTARRSRGRGATRDGGARSERVHAGRTDSGAAVPPAALLRGRGGGARSGPPGDGPGHERLAVRARSRNPLRRSGACRPRHRQDAAFTTDGARRGRGGDRMPHSRHAVSAMDALLAVRTAALSAVEARFHGASGHPIPVVRRYVRGASGPAGLWGKTGGLCLPGRSEKIREVVCRFGAHVPIRAVWLARAADWAVRRRPGARVIRGTSASSNRTARSAGCVVNWRAPPATGTDGSVAANASRSNSTRRGGPAADRQPPLPRTGRKVAAGIPDGGLAHATVGRAAARARDRSTRPSRRRCRRRVRTAAARLT